MLTLVLAMYWALVTACAVALVAAVILARTELRHRRDHCPGVWLGWPSAGRPWLVRCDRCRRGYLATRRARELATADLERAQTLRALALDGASLLREERRPLP